jgi:hypothetical protein
VYVITSILGLDSLRIREVRYTMREHISKGLAQLGAALANLDDEADPNDAFHQSIGKHSAAIKIQSYHRMRRSKKHVAAMRAKIPGALNLAHEEFGIGEVVMDEEEKDGTFYTSMKPISSSKAQNKSTVRTKIDESAKEVEAMQEEKRGSSIYLDTPVHSPPAYARDAVRSPGKCAAEEKDAPPLLPPAAEAYPSHIATESEGKDTSSKAQKSAKKKKSKKRSNKSRRATADERGEADTDADTKLL